ncbi:MAG: CHAT domain-containing protein [Thermoanaerobaculia bacterium]|nr:CHAT domain-containing protein [Thermoanaerobaculia bacterium]
MRPGRATAAALGLLLSLPTGLAADPEGPFAPCEAGLAESPTELEPARCFYRVARASNLWEAARRRLEALVAERPDLPWLRFYLASLVMQRGGGDAEGLFADAAEGFAARGDAAGETYSRINRARLLEGSGRLDEALAEAGRAREAATHAGGPLLLEVRMLELRFRYLLGDERVGVQRDLARLAEHLGEEASYALRRDLLGYRAAVAFELGQDDDALALYARLAGLARGAADAPAVAATELNRLRVILARAVGPAEREEVRRRAEAALAAARDAGMPSIEAAALLTLGRLTEGPEGAARLEEALTIARRVESAELERDALALLAHRQIDRPLRALELADASLAAADRVSDPLSPAERWLEQLAVRWRAGGRDAALAHAERIFDLLEAASRGESADTSRARLFAVWSEAYYWVAGRLFREHLETGEREPLARGFEVQERMRARLLSPAEGGEPAALPGLDALERSLGEREAVLGFQLVRDRDVWGGSPGGAWVTVSTRHGTRLLPLPGLAALEPRIAMALALLARRDGSHAAAAAALHRDLLEEAVRGLPLAVDRLLLVPDGPLHRLPFAALPDAAGRPLGDRFELARAPSAAVWQRLRALAAPRAAGIVAVVDPLSDGSVSAARAWLPADAPDLGPLLFARREGRALTRAFGPACRVLAGSEAAEPAVTARLPGARLVHFATHALVDSRSPERSAVVLAPAGGADGLLAAPEIARLELDAPLVVLSTCDSAAGPLLRGEGAMSLARAFFQGGARTVVASLWRLRDREAASLFDRFYRHLGRGATVATALRMTQRDLRRRSVPARAWAGVTVLGDGGWAPAPETRRGGRSAPAWLLALLAVAAAGLAARAHRRAGR